MYLLLHGVKPLYENSTSSKLGKYFRSTGTAILLMLIPIVDIFIAIWLLVLFFQVVGTSMELSKESGSPELNRYAIFRIIGFLVIIATIIAAAFMVIQIIDLIVGLPYSIISNPSALVPYIAGAIAAGSTIITGLILVVQILAIIAAAQLKQFFQTRVEGPAREKGMQGAGYFMWGNLLSLILGFIPIAGFIGAIIGFVLEVMGCYTTGSGFQKMGGAYSSSISTGTAAPPAGSFSGSTAPPGTYQQQPAPSATPAAQARPAQENRFCPFCGGQLPPDPALRFCPNCGGSVPNV